MEAATEPRLRRRRRRRRAAFAFVVFGLFLFLLFRWRDRAADRWMAAMRVHGEKFTLAELGLAGPVELDPVLDALETAAGQFSALDRADVSASVRTLDDAVQGVRRISWKEPQLNSVRGRVLGWAAGERIADELEPIVTRLRADLVPCRGDPGWRPTALGTIPNFVRYRTVAQSLHELTMVELHRGRLEAAQRDLWCLLRLTRLHEDSCLLVQQMIRTAILGLATDAVWNALQAEGWTEAQWAEVQAELEKALVIPALPRIMEVERVGQLMGLELYRREGPASLAWRRSLTPGNPPPAWMERVAYHFWKMTRCGKDRLLLLQRLQEVIERYRRLAQGETMQALGPPPAWPVEWWQKYALTQNLFPFSEPPNFVRVGEVVTWNDTLRQLSVTAVALERYRLRHGNYPARLQQLVPDFLKAIPREPISGCEIQYAAPGDRDVLLWAVGYGAPDTTNAARFLATWNGNIAVGAKTFPRWPKPATPEPVLDRGTR